MAALSTGKILKHALLPGILPRLYAFFASGFKHVSYMMALVYQAVRLLPPGHPYLNPANFGRYGIRHVIAEAGNNLVISRRNADQVIIYFTILAGVVILALQVGLLIMTIVIQPVLAAGPAGVVEATLNNLVGVTSIYGHGAGNATHDLAFIILDRVFGLDPRIYGSCVSLQAQCIDIRGNAAGPPGGPYPYASHIALHRLLEFYSIGIFLVSVIVILYFVTTIVGETAVTGSPFGQRFNKTWGPLRLIIFFALLVPLHTSDRHQGLNMAQMLTFWTAKFGSNFATNAWGWFNLNITDSYLGEPERLIGTPNPPEINSLVRMMFVAKACKIAEEYAYRQTLHTGAGIQPYIVRANAVGVLAGGGNNAQLMLPTSFQGALAFTQNGNIEIRFGTLNAEKYPLEKGNVKAFCGILTVPVTSINPGTGAYNMQEVYFQMVKEMWTDPAITFNAACVRGQAMNIDQTPNCAAWPDTDWANNTAQRWNDQVRATVTAQIQAQIDNADFTVDPRVLELGWAGAAIWYNKVAQFNGEITAAVGNIPQGDKYPYLMEHIAAQNKQKNENINAHDAFNPALGDNKESSYPRLHDKPIASTLYNAFSLWDQTKASQTQGSAPTNNAFRDGINLIFGTEGVFSMRKNVDIHPLAQLSVLGKGMMDAAVRNLAIGFAGNGLSQLFANIPGGETLGAIGKATSTFLFAMGKATIVMSFILYYVLPFLPFIYFMFAVSGWIKSIFEAIVAMPLWALAHICRMDGQGIPGPAANNGYFLLLEIFLRPVLIVVGLIGSITVFAACVRGLNDVFDLVVSNLSGFDIHAENTGVGPSEIAYYRQPVDQFFFSVIYVIMVYMMATGFFKMIDQVPNNILRWMGVSVSTFSEAAGDPAGELSTKVYQGGQTFMGHAGDGGKLAALFGGGGR